MRQTATLVFLFLIILSGCSVQDAEPPVKPKKSVEKPVPGQQLKSKRIDTPAPSKSIQIKREEKPASPGSVLASNRLDHAFKGTWTVGDSSAEFTILINGGKVVVKGQDLEDNEPFKISHLRWDRSTLFATVLMPSTHHTLKIKLIILDNDKLQCSFTGDSFGMATWQRKN
jgi:hypothetical protein